jgi:hypothetical protein
MRILVVEKSVNWGGEIIVAVTCFNKRRLRKHFRYRDAIPGSEIF